MGRPVACVECFLGAREAAVERYAVQQRKGGRADIAAFQECRGSIRPFGNPDLLDVVGLVGIAVENHRRVQGRLQVDERVVPSGARSPGLGVRIDVKDLRKNSPILKWLEHETPRSAAREPAVGRGPGKPPKASDVRMHGNLPKKGVRTWAIPVEPQVSLRGHASSSSMAEIPVASAKQVPCTDRRRQRRKHADVVVRRQGAAVQDERDRNACRHGPQALDIDLRSAFVDAMDRADGHGNRCRSTACSSVTRARVEKGWILNANAHLSGISHKSLPSCPKLPSRNSRYGHMS